MRINTNLGALTAATNLTKVNDAVRSSAEKLSSGFRINKASDDAAGLGVANLFRSDIRALTQAQRNAEQATSVYAIAEGGATSIEKILERMKELAAQSASDSVDSGGRTRIQAEYDGLLKEIDRVTLTTEFQGSKLLAGTYGTSSAATALAVNMTSFSTSGKVGDYTFAKGAAGRVIASFTDAAGVVQTENVAFAATTKFANLGLTVQWNIVGAFADETDISTEAIATTAAVGGVGGSFLIGAARSRVAYNNADSNVLQVASMNLTSGTLGLDASVNGLVLAQAALLKIDTALNTVNGVLGNIGAGQNRLSNAIDNLKSTILNYQSAESTIRDLDMAGEMVTFSKNQILAQAGTAMLAQANQSGQGILKLLQ